MFAAFVSLPLAHSHAASLVLKANVLSLGIGEETHSEALHPADISCRMLDVAFGKRFAPPYGIAIGTILGDFFQKPSNSQSDFWLHGPSLDIYAFGGPEAPNWGFRGVAFGHFGVMAWSDTKFVRLGLGANWTLWVLNPEVEASWRLVRDRYAEGYPPVWHEQTYHQLSVFLRIGLGGWYEFDLAR